MDGRRGHDERREKEFERERGGGGGHFVSACLLLIYSDVARLSAFWANKFRDRPALQAFSRILPPFLSRFARERLPRMEDSSLDLSLNNLSYIEICE